MKVKNKNNASKKTKAAIQESFAYLLEEKNEIKNITVTELARRANITRAAFYTHYNNIYDVAKEMQEEAMNILKEQTKNTSSIEDVDHYFDSLFAYLEQNQEIYSMMLKSDDPLIFINRLEKIITKELYEALKNYPIEHLKLSVSFFTNGCSQLIIQYFRKEIDCSLEEINTYIKNLFKTFFII